MQHEYELYINPKDIISIKVHDKGKTSCSVVPEMSELKVFDVVIQKHRSERYRHWGGKYFDTPEELIDSVKDKYLGFDKNLKEFYYAPYIQVKYRAGKYTEEAVYKFETYEQAKAAANELATRHQLECIFEQY